MVIALLLPISATIEVVMLAGISGELLAGFFAFGLVALLYLVMEELLVKAHEIPDTPFSTAIFFVGFLMLIAIKEIL